MLNSINLKNLTAKAIIGILIVGGLVTQSDKKAVASNGVQGLELRYLDSAVQCGSDPTQGDIEVKVYDAANDTLLETLSKEETYTTSEYDSIDNFRFEYIVNGLTCVDEGYNLPASATELLSKTDTVPDVGGFEGQASITNMLANLNSYEQLHLVEFDNGGQYVDEVQKTGEEWVTWWGPYGYYEDVYETVSVPNPAYDLQDVVLVVDNNPESLVPDDPDPTPPAPSSNVVDLELVLAVDVSGSVDNAEFDLQVDGYMDAFRSAEVQNAIKNMPNGIAVTMLFWTSEREMTFNQDLNEAGHYNIDWFKLSRNGEEVDNLDSFISAVEGVTRTTTTETESYGGDSRTKVTAQTVGGVKMDTGTDIAFGISKSQELIENNAYYGGNKVIDLSADGMADNTLIDQADADAIDTYISDNELDFPNYLQKVIDVKGIGKRATKCGRGHEGGLDKDSKEVPVEHVFCPPVQDARDAAVNAGITINGLPIVGDPNSALAVWNREDELVTYFLNNVVGGNSEKGAFLVEALMDRDHFARKAKQKILAEITNSHPNNAPVARPDKAESLIAQPVTISVLDNDFDINNDALSITRLNDVQGGEAEIVNNEVVFTPGNTPGKYTFSYIVTDDATDAKTATADITVEVFEFAD